MSGQKSQIRDSTYGISAWKYRKYPKKNLYYSKSSPIIPFMGSLALKRIFLGSIFAGNPTCGKFWIIPYLGSAAVKGLNIIINRFKNDRI